MSVPGPTELVRRAAERLADVSLAPPAEILTRAEARQALVEDLRRALIDELGPDTDPTWAAATLGHVLSHLEVQRGQCGVCDRWVRGHGGEGVVSPHVRPPSTLYVTTVISLGVVTRAAGCFGVLAFGVWLYETPMLAPNLKWAIVCGAIAAAGELVLRRLVR